jgi:hypothetical protein
MIIYFNALSETKSAKDARLFVLLVEGRDERYKNEHEDNKNSKLIMNRNMRNIVIQDISILLYNDS